MTGAPRTDLLKQILASKADEVARHAQARPLNELRAAAADLPPTRGLKDALAQTIARGDAAVIAEIKKASPSRGAIRADDDFVVADLARDLAAHGATCLSVLTDERYFDGRDRYLAEARGACALPLLRKDFVIDPYQVFEARLLGADAVLLIVAALGEPMLRELAQLSAALGMDALVEAHDGDELTRALAVRDGVIGINNRDLRTFETSLDTTLDLLARIPDGRIVVTESGLRERADFARMRRRGVHAFLVGETLMRAARPGEKLRDLLAPEAT
ncbi:MAG: indole-3-glycerol phosphate synthase TrpC [bacterium]